MIEELWVVWAFALMVGLAVAAAIVIGRTGRERLPTLSPHHAAGAAILGVIGWEVAIYLPGSFQTLTVAILPGPGEAALPSALYVLTQGVYVAATVVAVVFVLRRHVWAAILAIGLCLVRIGLMTMNLWQFVQRPAMIRPWWPSSCPSHFSRSLPPSPSGCSRSPSREGSRVACLRGLEPPTLIARAACEEAAGILTHRSDRRDQSGR